MQSLTSIAGASNTFVINHVFRAHSAPSDKSKLDHYGLWQDIPAGHLHVDYHGNSASLEGTRREFYLRSDIDTLYATRSRYAYLGAYGL
jgi:hypothetical protein